MNKQILKVFLPLLLLIVVFLCLDLYSSIVFPWQQQNAIQTTLNWGGLAELPKNLENLSIEKEGSPFTRTFVIEFNANQEEIENWISKSKRLQKNTAKENGRVRVFEIYPGENQSYGGKVCVENNSVKIRISWS